MKLYDAGCCNLWNLRWCLLFTFLTDENVAILLKRFNWFFFDMCVQSNCLFIWFDKPNLLHCWTNNDLTCMFSLLADVRSLVEPVPDDVEDVDLRCFLPFFLNDWIGDVSLTVCCDSFLFSDWLFLMFETTAADGLLTDLDTLANDCSSIFGAISTSADVTSSSSITSSF